MSDKMREALERLRREAARVQRDEHKYAELAYSPTADTLESIADDIEAALAEQPVQGEVVDYARRLAVALHRNHYADEAPRWEPCDDLYGLLSQIDNMICGMTRTAPPAQHAVVSTAPAVPNGFSIINNEVLADLYKRACRKDSHTSDCATSRAPALTPGPCDCDFPAVPDDVAKDAARFRWLLDDHANAETRVDVRTLLVSMRTRSLSGARLDIDAAMLAAAPEVKS